MLTEQAISGRTPGFGRDSFDSNPEQLTVQRDGLSIPDRAINELLRYCGPTAIGVTRYTKETVVLAGTTVPPRERVVLGLGPPTATRLGSPEPEQLNLMRTPAGHFCSAAVRTTASAPHSHD